MKRLNLKLIIVALLGAAVGAGATYYVEHKPSESDHSQLTEIQSGPENMINPLLDCRDLNKNSTLLSDLKNKVDSTIDELKQKNMLGKVSFYFRDFSTTEEILINHKDVYSGASILKVPLMISYLKLAETNPSLLNEEIQNNIDPTSSNYVQETDHPNPLKFGQKYTVKALIERMIIDSDNQATLLLAKYRPDINVPQMMSEIKLPLGISGNDGLVHVDDSASIFRVLYRATYLSRAFSNSALELLTHSSFKRGLVAGIPANIRIAHKHGERRIDNVQQFNECGLVYAPNKAYLVCIFTEGDNLDNQIQAVATISSKIYEHVTSN